MKNQDEVVRSLYELQSGATIFSSQDKAIDQIISMLVVKVPAKFILLTAVTGQVITVAGDRGQIDLVALGSLIAGDLAASQEVARLIGEYQDYQMILREGKKTHAFISEAGPHLILFVQISRSVPLGWARMIIQEEAKKLERVLNTRPEKVESLELGLEQDELPDLFSSALDELWSNSG